MERGNGTKKTRAKKKKKVKKTGSRLQMIMLGVGVVVLGALFLFAEDVVVRRSIFPVVKFILGFVGCRNCLTSTNPKRTNMTTSRG